VSSRDLQLQKLLCRAATPIPSACETNRTPAISLEERYSAIKLHTQKRSEGESNTQGLRSLVFDISAIAGTDWHGCQLVGFVAP
jgi:hypothetical protein